MGLEGIQAALRSRAAQKEKKTAAKPSAAAVPQASPAPSPAQYQVDAVSAGGSGDSTTRNSFASALLEKDKNKRFLKGV